MGRQGVAEAEADGDVVVVRLGQLLGEPLVGAASVEVVGVDDAEGAADLGTMIREMSIDQITRSGNIDEEQVEDDFEEEDTLLDPTLEDLNDLEESEEEEEEEDLDESDTEEE